MQLISIENNLFKPRLNPKTREVSFILKVRTPDPDGLNIRKETVVCFRL